MVKTEQLEIDFSPQPTEPDPTDPQSYVGKMIEFNIQNGDGDLIGKVMLVEPDGRLKVNVNDIPYIVSIERILRVLT